jgi:hypothetical protein
VAYSIVFNADVTRVPPAVIEELRTSLTDIGESISGIPQSSVFWVSIDNSLFELTISGWVFNYLIDRRRNELVVVSVLKAERQTG